MKKFLIAALIIISILVGVSLSEQPTQATSVRDKLIEWRKGVWLSGGSTYTIWTPGHYFVLSMSGDSSNANLYYGCSQVSYHERGITRYQVQRYRELPGNNPTIFWKYMLTDNKSEKPYTPDTTLFNPNSCVIKEGVIYDAVVEVTDSTILIATCNGDKEMLFNNGKSVYMPADGGEFYSYRIEEF